MTSETKDKGKGKGSFNGIERILGGIVVVQCALDAGEEGRMTEGITANTKARTMARRSPLLARIIVTPLVFQYMVTWGLAYIWVATAKEVWHLTKIAVE